LIVKEDIAAKVLTFAIALGIVGTVYHVYNQSQKWKEITEHAVQVWTKPKFPSIRYALFDNDKDGTIDKIVLKTPTFAMPRAAMPGSIRVLTPENARYKGILQEINSGYAKRIK